jgi:hypothetical protein
MKVFPHENPKPYALFLRSLGWEAGFETRTQLMKIFVLFWLQIRAEQEGPSDLLWVREAFDRDLTRAIRPYRRFGCFWPHCRHDDIWTFIWPRAALRPADQVSRLHCMQHIWTQDHPSVSHAQRHRWTRECCSTLTLCSTVVTMYATCSSGSSSFCLQMVFLRFTPSSHTHKKNSDYFPRQL